MGKRSEPFLTLELSEAEARALLHCLDIGFVTAGKKTPWKGGIPYLGSTIFPGGETETAAAQRVARQIRPRFAGGIWFKVLAQEADDREVEEVQEVQKPQKVQDQCSNRHPEHADECHKLAGHDDNHHNVATGRRWGERQIDIATGRYER